MLLLITRANNSCLGILLIRAYSKRVRLLYRKAVADLHLTYKV